MNFQKCEANTTPGMRPYLGKQVTELQIPEVVDFLRYIFWGQILYVWAIPVIKFSVMLTVANPPDLAPDYSNRF
jgi:hypothetical protein